MILTPEEQDVITRVEAALGRLPEAPWRTENNVIIGPLPRIQMQWIVAGIDDLPKLVQAIAELRNSVPELLKVLSDTLAIADSENRWAARYHQLWQEALRPQRGLEKQEEGQTA